jgi:hypothetical protein
MNRLDQIIHFMHHLPRLDMEMEEDFVEEKDGLNFQLKKAAYHELAGEVVKRIEPHTEADHAALLINFLVGIGNVVGNRSHFVVESKPHGLRLFAALVGNTSKGRKGSSWGHIQRILQQVDANWAAQRIKSGLSSGEGLIYQVRDPLKDDEGEKDKRLLVLEEEFASTLRVAERQGNTLTKNPLAATNAHISILGHVTKEELKRYLSTTEIGNGFANRFLWVFVRRSKALPEGDMFHEENIDHLVQKLKDVLAFSQQVGEMNKDDAAKRMWAGVYEILSEGLPGFVGAVTSRAEAQTMRLACLYALPDQSPLIRVEHLSAALAVWDYCFASARYIFGDGFGNPLANEILMAIQAADQKGLTKTEISRMFSGKKSKAELDAALEMLIKNGFVMVKKEETRGRSRQRTVPI